MSIGERIKVILEEKQLKQVDFAKKLGISANYVNLLVNNKKDSISETLAKLIEETYGYSSAWIISGIEPKLICNDMSYLKSETINKIKRMSDDEILAILAFVNSFDEIKKLNKNKKARTLVTFLCVLISALSQAYVIQVFIQPANLLSSGFTGVAILIEKITSTYFGFSFSTSLGMIVLNVPVAILCYKNISPRFTLFSLLQVFLASLFLKVCQFQPLFNDILLNITFGGVSYGLMAVLVLRGNASTGGTDFIALYISNKKGKSIWEYVFVFNTLILMIFGSMFGWIHAGYSILFQFISTKTIDSFYHRYERVTLQITTKKSKEIVEAYIQYYRHGISCVEAIGGYSKQPMNLLHTVVSSYEVQDIIDLMKDVDPDLIVNVIKTENFYGGFYQQPIE